MIWLLKKIAQRKLQAQQLSGGRYLHIDAKQIRQINQLYLKGLLISGITGSFAIAAYLLPVYFYPELFKLWPLNIKLLSLNTEIYVLPQLLNLFLLISELFLLGYLNIYLIRKLSAITRFPHTGNAHFSEHIGEITRISLENFETREKQLGLNPFFGVSKRYLFFLLIFNKSKAFLSNIVLKIIIGKIVGRYMLRIYIDLTGLPVYFFWNAYATSIVFNRARYYIYAQDVIQYCLGYYGFKYKKNPLFREYIYEVLAQISIRKRAYNSAHFFLSSRLLEMLEIPVQTEYVPTNNLLNEFQKMPEELRDDLAIIFITGMILDGSLNRREERVIKELKSRFGSEVSLISDYRNYLRAFRQGGGVVFLKKYHDT